MEDVVISSAIRTPMGGFQGDLDSFSASELGGKAIEGAMEKADIDRVDEVIMGNVLGAGQGQAPARQASFAAGLDKTVPATTLNKVVGSIPFLGNILVGKKVGEGVFGVSFKIKGSPKNLKTTVNPIKTLTPRFITRTLEKIKGS